MSEVSNQSEIYWTGHPTAHVVSHVVAKVDHEAISHATSNTASHVTSESHSASHGSHTASHSTSHSSLKEAHGSASRSGSQVREYTPRDHRLGHSSEEAHGSASRSGSQVREYMPRDHRLGHSSEDEDMLARVVHSSPAQSRIAAGGSFFEGAPETSPMRAMMTDPHGQLGHQRYARAKTVKLHEFTSNLHGKFSDFVAGISQLAEQDTDELKDEMQKCFGMVKDLLKQEAVERAHHTEKLSDRCAKLEDALQRERKVTVSEKTALTEDLSAMKKRVDYLENTLGAWADKNTKEVEQLRKAQDSFSKELAGFHEAHEQHLEVEESLDTAVKGLTSAAEQTAKALAAAKAKLDQMHDGMLGCEHRCTAAEGRYTTLIDRLKEMDRRFESVMKSHVSELESVRGNHSALSDQVKHKHGELSNLISQRHGELSNLLHERHREFNSLLAEETRTREQHISEESSARQRSVSSLQAKLEEAERKHAKVSGNHDDQARELKALRDQQHRHTEEIGAMRTELGATRSNVDGTLNELEVTRDELDQVLGLLASVQKAWRPCQRATAKGRRVSRGLDVTSPKTPKAGYETSPKSYEVNLKPGHYTDYAAKAHEVHSKPGHYESHLKTEFGEKSYEANSAPGHYEAHSHEVINKPGHYETHTTTESYEASVDLMKHGVEAGRGHLI